MTNWHPSGQPFTPHNGPRYWANVLDSIRSSAPRPTVNVRNDQPRVYSGQPAISGAKVVTSGLSDGPTG